MSEKERFPDGISFENEKLNYSIHRYSSYSSNYVPQNILVDCPSDQSSRWSSHTNSPPQYLTLKLQRPAVVKKIKFGKFEKSHVCNLKKFQIYGGMDENNMVLLLESGLKNDSKVEVFNLRCVADNNYRNIAILYLKIVPLLSWGPTFCYSIWYVELHGQDDPMFTASYIRNYNMLLEVEIVKLCLKHFRQQGYDFAFKALQEQTQIRLEHPLITELHRNLVLDVNFIKTEELLTQCVNEGLIDEYVRQQDYRHTWHQLETKSSDQPATRGGHQLAIDQSKRLVYLYGGWDGYQDLSDLWCFDIANNTWTILCERSELFNGPTPRSCHKMIFDPISENIFILGRFLDNSIRTTDYVKSDFYLYDTRLRLWLQISDDTSQVGGPQLLFDHQMCIDPEKRTIYVFGGKVLTPRSVTTSATSEAEYSGLFSYHIATNTWTQILVDCHHASAAKSGVPSIKSRITHCMVFHTKTRKLYIFGGHRGKEEIDEFLGYDVDTQCFEVLNKKRCCAHGMMDNKIKEPNRELSSGHTLRATIDCERNEIYMFASLNKLKERREMQNTNATNAFWVYSLDTNQWSLIYSGNPNFDDKTKKIAKLFENPEPCPRYAHQLIYDEFSKTHYLFGGNPGKFGSPQLRLNDLWVLSLDKPKRNEILSNCRFLVRKLQFEELSRTNSIKAMQYLQSEVSQIIDHSNPKELNKFHKLAAILFKPHKPTQTTAGLNLESKNVRKSYDIIERKAKKFQPDETLINAEYDTDMNTNPIEDLSLESCESFCATNNSSEFNNSSSSGICDSTSSSYKKHHEQDFIYEMKAQRAFLFNKFVEMMPSEMVQPERNLSDFVHF